MRVAEEFLSLQGEGVHAGVAAWFVRFAGCDVGCAWCDSREAWGGGDEVAQEDIVERAVASGAGIVVVTGGEPLMQDLGRLTSMLRERGLRVHLETSGTHNFSGFFDWVCLSPKRHRPPVDEAFARADELKVVVASEVDFAFAEACAARAKEGCALLLQPEWSSKFTPAVVEYILNNQHWRLSLQTHKYIGII